VRIVSPIRRTTGGQMETEEEKEGFGMVSTGTRVVTAVLKTPNGVDGALTKIPLQVGELGHMPPVVVIQADILGLITIVFVGSPIQRLILPISLPTYKDDISKMVHTTTAMVLAYMYKKSIAEWPPRPGNGRKRTLVQ
jgi:hypothetical protein